MTLARAPLFLAERLVSQGGGLLFTAVLARNAAAEDAAAFFAAYAFAAIFQPILSNAVQPLAARHWRAGGLAAVIRIWAILQAVALGVIGPLIWLAEEPVAAILLLHAALAPGLLMATPLAAEDRRRTLVAILIGAALLGAGLRVGVYLATGDLALAAAFYAVEPVAGGLALAVASTRLARPANAGPEPPPFLAAAAGMVLAMGVTTDFWHSPVLLASAFLGAEDVVALALAMQLIMGLCLPANALCQSLFGPLARGDRAAPGVALWVAAAACVGAPALMIVAGEAVLTALYGPAGAGAASYAALLAPMAGLAALWRFGHIMGGLNGLARELALTRAAALIGQGLLLVWLIAAPSAIAIAAVTPLSMLAAAIIAPLFAPGLADLAREAAASAKRTACQAADRRRAFRLMFS